MPSGPTSRGRSQAWTAEPRVSKKLLTSSTVGDQKSSLGSEEAMPGVWALLSPC